MIDHLIRGLLLFIILAFGLPVIISLALSIMNNGRANFKAASHLVITVLKAALYVIADLADVAAEIIVKRYPKHPKWLQAALKASITALVILTVLFVLSALN